MARTSTKDRAVTALITQPSIKAAAAYTGVTEKTMHKWLNDPEFSRRVQQAQLEVMQGVTKSIVNSGTQAIATLVEIMNDADNPAGARVTAARTVLDNTLKIFELQTIERRIEAIEKELRL